MKTTGRKTKYGAAGIGGTFDHFHLGHAWFLQQAAALCELLIVGVTTESLLSEKPFPSALESYDQRAKMVATFLTTHDVNFELMPLSTVQGPTITDKRIEAIIVTEETKSGGAFINESRLKLGLTTLAIETIPLQLSKSSVLISSRSVRAGTHNRSGAAYLESIKDQITLNEQQRKSMRIVLGELISEIPPPSEDSTRYVVGDSTLRRFQVELQPYEMAIIDGKEQRLPYHPLVIERSAIDLVLVNPPGVITPMLSQGLTLALRQKLTHIFIEGEEDLAAAVLQLLLPLGCTIYYGQPSVGLVRWPVTENSKEKTALLLNPHFQTNPKLLE
ncbi:pantetheine-phosphate adenylyltransferase [Candidatus Woesebacteria bacterium]|nr:pantetheine-phosphate adenylyltransferase [Candidatus Woesebacteria bacterium]